ncbi:MAG: Maf-like protein [Pseudomonadota bacterium]
MLVLASKSPFRKAMLEAAGLSVTAMVTNIDERAVEAPLQNANLPVEDIAMVLAEAKAQNVAQSGEVNADDIVIGCDQTLSLGDEQFHKPHNMEEARRNLLKLSGKTHTLHSALVLVRGGETIWRHVEPAHMTMRNISPEFVGRYLAAAGDAVLSSVGVYQIEGRGIQLFEKIAGDHSTIVGLPLLPLLKELRVLGAIDG